MGRKALRIKTKVLQRHEIKGWFSDGGGGGGVVVLVGVCSFYVYQKGLRIWVENETVNWCEGAGGGEKRNEELDKNIIVGSQRRGRGRFSCPEIYMEVHLYFL